MVDIANDDSAEYFQHDPLDLDHSTIRLVRLQPTRLSTITITLEHYHSDSCPEYHALSYVWGPPQPSDTIMVNNKAFIVRRNLFDFLSMYGEHIEQETYIWIDQLCIDQSHVTERNHQVGLMGKVFGAAIEVVAWLGPSEAGDVFPNLDVSYIDPLQRVELQMSRKESIYFERLGQQRDRDRCFTTALNHVASKPYWTRLWIVQELLLARTVTVFFGSSCRGEAQIEEWLRAYQVNGDSVFDQDFRSKIRGLKKLLSSRHRGAGLSLADAINRFAMLDCEDPRDKVFGLMGIVDSREVMVVDYGASIESVFAEVCIRICADDIPSGWESVMTRPLERMSNELRKVLPGLSSDRLADAILKFRDMWVKGHRQEGVPVLEPYLDAAAFNRLSTLGLLLDRGQ